MSSSTDMEGSRVKGATFHPFPKLPPEIRLMIMDIANNHENDDYPPTIINIDLPNTKRKQREKTIAFVKNRRCEQVGPALWHINCMETRYLMFRDAIVFAVRTPKFIRSFAIRECDVVHFCGPDRMFEETKIYGEAYKIPRLMMSDQLKFATGQGLGGGATIRQACALVSKCKNREALEKIYSVIHTFGAMCPSGIRLENLHDFREEYSRRTNNNKRLAGSLQSDYDRTVRRFRAMRWGPQSVTGVVIKKHELCGIKKPQGNDGNN
ncbi:hypothetical protein F5Y15DRAFT_414501 [Xylariaceae sp. FL0016]|nr:hypothetical protein F5Y15DRAFT_414501 [Xylariaceae sp. FL0016]